ncbi:unnamed protein product [Gongylonema pulchrum]|uniref:Lipoprotein n=1 Tax=Gongylonema pulchrum TaxID=637853 RepID=A0A183DQT5_9BILA|nr:unnamed protein product [Gongylonema pulchrum]
MCHNIKWKFSIDYASFYKCSLYMLVASRILSSSVVLSEISVFFIMAVIIVLSGCVARRKDNYVLVKDANVPEINDPPQRYLPLSLTLVVIGKYGVTKKPVQGWGLRTDDTLKNVATLPNSESAKQQCPVKRDA